MRASTLSGRSTASMAALLCVVLLAASPAAAQKKGGTLRLYHNDNPPSTSLHEEATIASVTPFAAIFNNLGVRSGQGSRKHRHRDSGSRRELVLGFHQHETDLQASAGRQMARRPAVHGKGRA